MPFLASSVSCQPLATSARARSITVPDDVAVPGLPAVARAVLRSRSQSGTPETFLQSPSHDGLHRRFQLEQLQKLDSREQEPSDRSAADSLRILKDASAKRRANEMLMGTYVDAFVQRMALRQNYSSSNSQQRAKVRANARQFTSKYADMIDLIEPHLTIQAPGRRRTVGCCDMQSWYCASPPPNAQESAAYVAFCQSMLG